MGIYKISHTAKRHADIFLQGLARKTKQILQLITLKDVITLSGGLPILDHILDQISAYLHRINMIAMEYNEVDGWYSS